MALCFDGTVQWFVAGAPIDVIAGRAYRVMVRPRSLWAVIAVVIAIAGFLIVRKASDARAPAAPSAAGRPGQAATSPATAGAAATRPPQHVIRLATAEERKAIAERIAKAREARVQQAPPRPPSLPADDDGDSHDLERAAPQLKAALGEAIPFLAECYKTGPARERRPAVLMTLTGDRDVGTLIDADQLRDPDGKPLDAGLESCLRTTLSSLELPPLGATQPLQLKYSFVIDDD